MSCPPGPFPDASWTVWRGPVPGSLTTFAVHCLDIEAKVPYGYEWTTEFDSEEVLAIKQHHTWTYKHGKLYTGLCIPGITLYKKAPHGMQGGGASETQNPDPNLGMFNDGPTDWPVVLATAGAIVTVALLFAFAIKKSKRAP